MTEEIRRFKASEALLYDVITRQAGSVEKAILEAIMNSVDAGAKKCEIKIDTDAKSQLNLITIVDDGKGMSYEEFLKYFEIFGAVEKRDKFYGEFQMGRGQIFAHGKTTWKTRDVIATVDIKNKGLDYVITKGNENVNGTVIIIELYEDIFSSSVEEIQRQSAFAPIKITVDGEKYNRDEHEQIADNDIATYYYAEEGGESKIYNRGIFVRTHQPRELQFSVVSKKPLKLNFARNDLISSDEDNKILLSNMKDVIFSWVVHNAKNLTSGEKDSLCSYVINVSLTEKQIDTIRTAKIFRTTNNNYVSLLDIQEGEGIMFDNNSRVADDLFNHKIYLFKNNNMLSAFFNNNGVKRVSLNDLKKRGLLPEHGYLQLNNVSDRKTKVLHHLQEFTHRTFHDDRKLIPIQSAELYGVTDGHSWIGINHNFLQWKHITAAISVLIHEIAHDDSTEQTDTHGEEYYKSYYHLWKAIERGVSLKSDVVIKKPADISKEAIFKMSGIRL